MADLDDFFGGSNSAPSLSWDKAKKNTKVVGTIVDEPRVVQKTQMDDGAPLFWSADRKLTTADTGNKVMYPIFRIKTSLRDWDMTSGPFQYKMEQGELDDMGEDEGVRDLHFGQVNASKGIRKAMQAARTRPEVGGVVTMTLTGKTPVGKNFKLEFDISYAKPTEASRKVAADYAASIGGDTAAEDAWSIGDSEDEPPF